MAAWDILGGTETPGEDVLVVDGTGRHVALSAASVCHCEGARVQFAMVDEGLAQEQAYAERVVWRKWAHEIDLPICAEANLTGVRTEGNGLVATLCDELTGLETKITADQVIYDYGTIPAAEIYFDLRDGSCNKGVTDLTAWTRGEAQQSAPPLETDATGFELHRIGDAVSSRNIHAAILDALRLCQSC